MSSEQPASVLDDLARVQLLDTRNMLRLINELPEQCETALGIGRSFIPSEPVEPPSLVYLSGIGDSGTAADMAAVAAGEHVQVPVISDHGGPLPKFVTENALVIIVDYTGNNPSSARVYRDAKLRGCNIICVTSGGKLRETASKDAVRLVRIPPGQPTRSAIGYLFVPVVALFEQLGLAQGLIDNLSFGIRLMKNVRESLRIDNPTTRNVAKQIAIALEGKTVVVYGAQDYRSAVASRWKSQLAANAKVPVSTGYFPDLAQGNISSWESVDEAARNTAFVLLKDSQDRSEVPALMEAAKSVLEGYKVIDAEMKGATLVERLLYGVYLADYVSYYLALLSNVNPTPLDFVKRVDDWFTVKESADDQPDQSPTTEPGQ